LRIRDVRALQMRVKNVADVYDGTQDVLVVEVTTTDGVVGLGEVVSSSYVAKAVIEAPRSGAGRHGLRELIVGMDPMDTEEVWRVMLQGTSWYGRRAVAVHAMAGIDVALWDIKGQVLGQPVYKLLGTGQVQSSPVKAYASVLWGDTIGDTERLAQGLLDRGFRALKFGFGPIGRSLENDVAMVHAARRAIGDNVALMVDAGRRWTVDEAIERCQALGAFDLGWIEEPVSPDDLPGYAAVARRSPVPIAGAETEDIIPAFEAFMDAGVTVIQPDLGRVGLTQGMKIARLARDRGVRCVPHCFGTGINTAASIHWMTATGGGLVEYPMQGNGLCRDLVTGVPGLENGHVVAPDLPGLGVSLAEQVMREYAVAD